MPDDPGRFCRLCPATLGASDSRLMCFDAETAVDTKTGANVAEILNRHFWFELDRERDASAFVCRTCWLRVDAFHEFYQSVLILYDTRSSQVAVKSETESNAQAFDITVIKPEPLGSSEDDAKRVNGDDTYVISGSNSDVEDDVNDIDDDSPRLQAAIELPPIDIKDESDQSTASTNEDDKGEDVDKDNDQLMQPTARTTDESRIGTRRTLAAKSGRYRDEDDLIRRFMRMECDLCSAKFSTHREACEHLLMTHGKASGYLKCCDIKFHKRCKAVEHCRWHVDPRQFDCDICSRNFKTAIAVSTHRIRAHPTQSGDVPFRYRCDQCDAQFQLAVLLEYHQRRRHQPNAAHRLLCTVCYKQFKTKAAYDRHNAVDHQRLQCPDCDKWLKNVGSLKQHQEKHRLAPKRCPDCGADSANRWALIAHRRLVHDEPKHRCPECGKRLKSAQSLRAHMSLHTGTNCCGICPRTFGSQSSMYNHRKRVHAEEVFAAKCAPSLQCGYCPLRFDDESGRLAHQRLVHAAQLEVVSMALAQLSRTTLVGRKRKNH